jgi:hypothetical protein
VTRGLVATVVAAIYAAAGRHIDETTIDVWQFQLDDVDDGPDVLPIVRQLTRERGGFVRADEVWRAVIAERERAARSAEYQRPVEAVAELEAAPPRWEYDEPMPETTAEWRAFARRRLAAAKGPLATGLRHAMNGQPRPRPPWQVTEEDFFPTGPDPEPGSFG